MNASDVMNDIIWKEKNIQINQSEYHHRIHFLSIRSSTHCPSLHRSDNPTVSALLKGLIRWLWVYRQVHELPRPQINTIGYVNDIELAFIENDHWKSHEWLRFLSISIERNDGIHFDLFFFFLLDIKHNPDSSIFHGKRICSGPSLCESPSWRW